MNPLETSVLTVAPMCYYPPIEGASKRIVEITDAIAGHGYRNVLLGKDFVYDAPGPVRRLELLWARERCRSMYGIEALLTLGHYNETKHCKKRWLDVMLGDLEAIAFDAIYVHFLYAYPFFKEYCRGKPLLIDTANSEWQWYDRYAESSRNPLVKLLCHTSKRRVDHVMEMLPAGTVMVHCSESDLEDYRAARPDLCHLHVPHGFKGSARKRFTSPDGGRKRLLFFSSLSGKMNRDALAYFAESFWPVLKDVATLTVAGSHPSREIRELCSAQGWVLRPNLSDDEVVGAFDAADFSILPYEYGVGGKLKLNEACGRGIPVLCTPAGACGQANLPEFVTISDSPERWRSIITEKVFDPADIDQEVGAFLERSNWVRVVSPLIKTLEGLIGRASRPPRASGWV
jgi:hypothetical protein